MDFSIDDSQQMVVDTVRTFTERELVPHEDEVERTGQVRPELVDEIRSRAVDAGLYAANMPVELDGGGLDDLTLAMAERAFGWTSYALQYIVARPSNILRACTGDQVGEYLAAHGARRAGGVPGHERARCRLRSARHGVSGRAPG